MARSLHPKSGTNGTETYAAAFALCRMHVKKAGSSAAILDKLHKNKRCCLTVRALIFRKHSLIYFFFFFFFPLQILLADGKEPPLNVLAMWRSPSPV